MAIERGDPPDGHPSAVSGRAVPQVAPVTGRLGSNRTGQNARIPVISQEHLRLQLPSGSAELARYHPANTRTRYLSVGWSRNPVNRTNGGHSMTWTMQQVAALAPDTASLTAARKLLGRWSGTGCHGTALWGLCKGSGAKRSEEHT